MNNTITNTVNADGYVTTTVVKTYEDGTTSTMSYTLLGGAIINMSAGGDGP